MECASEDTENITIFLQNFLDILHEVKNDPNYVWKPWMIMADENGTNKRAVENVLGEDMRQRITHVSGTFCNVHEKYFTILIKKISWNWQTHLSEMQ